MSKAEEWRDIPTYEMYQASSLGEVMRQADVIEVVDSIIHERIVINVIKEK